MTVWYLCSRFSVGDERYCDIADCMGLDYFRSEKDRETASADVMDLRSGLSFASNEKVYLEHRRSHQHLD